MNDIHRVLNTPLGHLPAWANANGIRAIGWPGSEAPATPSPDDSSMAAGWLDQLGAQLTAYFAGERFRFDVPIAADGTPFQQAVWNALRAIPFGETRSYGEIARQIGRPAAARAVGGAAGANPMPLIVPCHRVIGADGRLTGFAGGLAAKRQLLDFEAGRQPLVAAIA